MARYGAPSTMRFRIGGRQVEFTFDSMHRYAYDANHRKKVLRNRGYYARRVKTVMRPGLVTRYLVYKRKGRQH